MADTCPLCGGVLEDHEISEERENEIRKAGHDLDNKDVHATVCSECGHISYHSA